MQPSAVLDRLDRLARNAASTLAHVRASAEEQAEALQAEAQLAATRVGIAARSRTLSTGLEELAMGTAVRLLERTDQAVSQAVCAGQAQVSQAHGAVTAAVEAGVPAAVAQALAKVAELAERAAPSQAASTATIPTPPALQLPAASLWTDTQAGWRVAASPTDNTPPSAAPLSPLGGSCARRVVGRMSRCPGEAVAAELGCLALLSLAQSPVEDQLQEAGLRAQCVHAVAQALQAHGERHSAVALAGCEALQALLAGARRWLPAGAARDGCYSAVALADCCGCVAGCLSSHAADPAVQAAGLAALLALLPPERPPAAPDSPVGEAAARAHAAGSAAASVCVAALWAHPSSQQVQACGCALAAALAPQQHAQLVALGGAQALVGALRGGGAASGDALAAELRRCAATALWRLATAHEEACAALRYAGAADALRALSGGEGEGLQGREALTDCAARGALLALAAPPPAPQPVARAPAHAQEAAEAKAASLMARARAEAAASLGAPERGAAYRAAMRAQEEAAAALQRQIEEAQAMLGPSAAQAGPRYCEGEEGEDGSEFAELRAAVSAALMRADSSSSLVSEQTEGTSGAGATRAPTNTPVSSRAVPNTGETMAELQAFCSKLESS